MNTINNQKKTVPTPQAKKKEQHSVSNALAIRIMKYELKIRLKSKSIDIMALRQKRGRVKWYSFTKKQKEQRNLYEVLFSREQNYRSQTRQINFRCLQNFTKLNIMKETSGLQHKRTKQYTSKAPVKLHFSWFVFRRGITTERTGIVGLYFAINLCIQVGKS